MRFRQLSLGRFFFHLFGSMLLCLLVLNASVAEPVKAGVHELKSAYIFNFIRFTDWPQVSGASAIKLHVINDAAIESIMQTIAEKQVAKQIGLQVDACATDACVQESSVLYIGKSSGADYQRQLRLIADRPVLTISDIPGFASQGGMIEIKYHNKKLTFVVNLQAVQRAGLYISAQLLQLGEVVGRDNE